MSTVNEIASASNKFFGRAVELPWRSAEELAGAVARNEGSARGVFVQFVEDSLMAGTSALDKLAPRNRLEAVKDSLNFEAWGKANPELRDIVSKSPDFEKLGWEIYKRISERNLAETGGELRVSPEELLRMSYANFDRLIGQMSPAIREGRWSSILVDGVSGKPIGDVLAEVMRLHSAQLGMPAPSIEYIATRRLENIKPAYLTNLSTRIDGLRPTLGSSRVLVVTDILGSGNSLRPIFQRLEKSHQYDVASLYNSRADVKEIMGYKSHDIPEQVGWLPSNFKTFGGMKIGMADSGNMPLYSSNKQGLRETIGIDVDKSSDSTHFRSTVANIPQSRIDSHMARVGRFETEIKQIAAELYAKHLAGQTVGQAAGQTYSRFNPANYLQRLRSKDSGI